MEKINFQFLFKIFTFFLTIINNIYAEVLTHSQIKYINLLNETYFSCDDGNQILSLDKFNDDFCDCEDGSDENRTNACINGKFYCENRFYESKVISSSKLNDGICDCCDGSDEFNLGCPKTCIDLSTKEYDKLMDQFLTLKMIVTNFNEENYMSFFNYNKNIILKIINAYNESKELLSNNYLLKSYLNKIELSMTEENDNLVDENGISLSALRRKIESNSEKIRGYDRFLKENESLIKSYEIFSIFRDVNEDCMKVNYKYFECELCANTLKCSGYKKSNKYRSKYLGSLTKFEDNAMIFENGGKCFIYNKKFSAKVYIECGSSESITFKEKINGCHYEFVYTTKIGCNSLKLKALQERINIFIKDIK